MQTPMLAWTPMTLHRNPRLKVNLLRKVAQIYFSHVFCILLCRFFKSHRNFLQGIWNDNDQGRFLAERIFSRIFIFGPPDFFTAFFSSFLWAKVPRKVLQENPPGKPRQIPPKLIQPKSPTHFCRGAAATMMRP